MIGWYLDYKEELLVLYGNKMKGRNIRKISKCYLCDTRLWLDSRRKYSFSRAIYSVFYDVALLFFLEDRYRGSRKLTSCFHDVNFLLVRSLFFIFTMLTSCFRISGYKQTRYSHFVCRFAPVSPFLVKWIVSIKWLFAIF